MDLFFTVLYFIVLSTTAARPKNRTCNEFQANFTIKDAVGAWHVVAIIPEKLFPNIHKPVSCYIVEFRETDTAALRWLVNNTVEKTAKTNNLSNIEGIVIRQRYHSERPFDVWSKSVEGVNGCYEQVLSLDADESELYKAITHDDMMQLHLLEAKGTSGPFLLQMLWGRMIAAVIYRRQQGVTQEELKPVFELMVKLRGPQRIPRICDRPLRDNIRQI